LFIVVPSKEEPKVIMQHPKVERQAESERLFKILEKIVKQD
jgi:hypothetical protein